MTGQFIYKYRKRFFISLLVFVILFFGVQKIGAQSPDFGFEYATALSIGTKDLRASIMQIINIALSLLGIIAIIIILYGGWLYMTASGDANQIEKAKKVLINGVIGLVIILMSYSIAYFLVRYLTNATGGDGGRKTTPTPPIASIVCSDPNTRISKPYMCTFNPLSRTPGDFVSISGGEFETYVSGVSKVRLYQGPSYASNTVNIEAGVADCGGTPSWSNNNIVIELPDSIPIGTYKWFITTGTNLTFDGNDGRIDTWGQNTLNKTLNVVSGSPSAGIACVTPNKAQEGATVTVYGKRLQSTPQNVADSLVFYNNINLVPASSGVVSWSETQIKVKVPNGAIANPGGKEVQMNVVDYGLSNGANFDVSCGGGGGSSGCGSNCCYGSTTLNQCRESSWCGGGVGDPCNTPSTCGGGSDGCQPGLYCDSTECACKSGMPRIDWISPGDGAVENLISIGGYNFKSEENKQSNNYIKAYWDFEEGGGSIVKDRSGKNNDGKIFGPTWVTGKKGSALSFDGVDDHVSLSGDSVKFKKDMTISTWVKWDEFFKDKHGHGIFSKSDRENQESVNGYTLYQNTTQPYNKIKYFIKTYQGTSYTVSSTSFNTGVWYHIGMTYDGSRVKLYVDGVLDSSAVVSGDIYWAGEVQDFFIGSIYDKEGSKFHGSIDDTVIYEKALTQSQMMELYNFGSVSFKEGIFGLDLGSISSENTIYLPFDEMTGNIAYDKSGNNNNGTLSNFSNSDKWITGKINNGLRFFGNNELVTVSNPFNTNYLDKLTVSAWVKYNSFPKGSPCNQNSCLVGSAIIDIKNWWNDGVGFSMRSINDKFSFSIIEQKKVPKTILSSTTIELGKWYYVAGVYDGKKVRLYVDGVEQDSFDYSGKINVTTDEVWVGQSTTSLLKFDGIIDDVFISDYALGTREINNIVGAPTVYFCGGADCSSDGTGSGWIVAKEPACRASRTSDLIIVEVPDGAIDGPIKIVKALGNEYFDTSNNSYGNLITNFDVNNTVRPGLCSVSPNTGGYGDAFVITGKNFQSPDITDIYFGRGGTYKAENISITNDTTASATAPNIQKGLVDIYAVINKELSNYIYYDITSVQGGPAIDYFWPINGPEGQYITIYGSNFGTSQGVGDVEFNGLSAKANGGFDFPDQCKTDYWSDNQIVVKVPKGASTGKIKIITNNKTSTDTAGKTPENFTINTNPLSVGLCKIDPISGPIGTKVDIYGERFNELKVDTVRFSTNIDVSISPTNDNKIDNAEAPNDTTPTDYSDDAVSGPITALQSSASSSKSNGINFQVADCRKEQIDCSATGKSCCRDGSCRTECSTNTASQYQWTVNTTTFSSCGGYSLNQCSAATNCPNSPGQCSPSPSKIGVDIGVNCGDKFCDNTYSECGYDLDCVYDTSSNKCEIDKVKCDISKSTTLDSQNKTLSCKLQNWATYPRVGYWNFNEKDGGLATVYDISVNNNEGYRNGTTRVGGRFGNALEFNGTSDFVEIADSDTLDFGTSDFTVEAWFKLKSISGTQRILAKGSSRKWMLGVSSNKATMYLDDGADTIWIGNTGKDLSLDSWYHIVATIDRDGNGQIYLNGSSYDAPKNISAINDIDDDSVLYVGRQGTVDYFNGIIDEVAIYNRVLSSDEVMSKYASGDKDYVWQYSVDGGCIAGSFEDVNEFCTLGSINAPVLCVGCQDGFGCSSKGGGVGSCQINKNVCPVNSICDTASIESDGYNACKENIEGECGCCCRVGYSDTDCCAGLTCENKDCGTDDETYEYGYCGGCAVWQGSTLLQNQSDEKCGCTSSTRVCVVDENNENYPLPKADNGFCGDCSTINSITFDSDDDGDSGDADDIKNECENHSVCCYDGSVGGDGCYTCNTLRVVENDCDNSSAPSPSPQKNSQDVCVNSNITANFNLELNPTSLAYGASIKQCNNGGLFNPTACNTTVAGDMSVINNTMFSFDPTSNLNPNSWYQITFDQDMKSINGLKLSEEYSWYFKASTSTVNCKPDNVKVLPLSALLTTVDSTQTYNSIALQNCNILDPDEYGWVWNSSIPTVATISNDDTTPSDSRVDAKQTATAKDKDGTTTISAKTEGATGKAQLTVELKNPEVIKYWPNCKEACLNASMGAEFNIPMDSSSLNSSNIELYKWICGNGEVEKGEDCDDGNFVGGDGCSPTCLNEGSDLSNTLNKDLIAYFTMDGISNTKVYETINEKYGNLINGTNNNFAKGKFGRALKFNSVSKSYVDAGDYFDLGLGDYSISFWIKLPANKNDSGSNSAWNGIISKGWTTNAVPNTWAFTTGNHETGPLTIFYSESKIAGSWSLLYNYNLVDNIGPLQPNWHHFAVTRKVQNESANFTFYIDGEKNGEVKNGTLTDLSNSDSLYFGLAEDRYLNLTLDDIRFYKVALSENQMLKVYNKASDICGNGLVDTGEDCDGDSFPAGCDSNTCLNTGSNNSSQATCGNGNKEQGEDCDDGNINNNDGCSDNCLNEGTSELSSVVLGNITPNTNNTLVNLYLPAGKYFEPNSYYRLFFFNDSTNDKIITSSAGKSLAKLNYDFDKDTTNDSFSWSFQTKDLFCSPDRVLINPNDSTLRNINTTEKYESTPYGAPDACNVDGQRLNPYSYIWGWNSTQIEVASITNNNNYPSCGNSLVEIGEDCDDGNSISGDGCNSNCLNEGSDGVKYICGDGKIGIGEDCDGKPFPSGCDAKTCLNTGSVSNVSVCGNKKIETGEDCDDGNIKGGDGCSDICLNEGARSDSYIDHIQTATSKSPGNTTIESTVNYCSNRPVLTCDSNSNCSPGTCSGGVCSNDKSANCSSSAECNFGTCINSKGTADLEVVCGYKSDGACNVGVCNDSNLCTNNLSKSCTTETESVDCDFTGLKTCDYASTAHSCSLKVWGGSCSKSTKISCKSDSDCPDTESCNPKTDCNYCKNNISIECRANEDCNLGVGYDSCCNSRPRIENNYPDPTYYDYLTNPSALSCVNNDTPKNKTDDYCSALGKTAECQTYSCIDTNKDTTPDTCTAYGKCNNGSAFADPPIYCLNDNDCPQDSYSTCNKSCTDDSDCNDIVCGACRNAQINIVFNQLMDSSSFTGNGVCANNSTASCEQHSDCSNSVCLKNIRLGVKYDDAAVTKKNCPSGYYSEDGLVSDSGNSKTLFAKIVERFKKWWNVIVGKKSTMAAEYYCAIPGVINSINSNNKTTAIFTPQGLKNNLLDPGIDYTVTVKHKVKRDNGVAMGTSETDDVKYSFTPSDTECLVETVDIYIEK